ncbi:MAG: response regulator transcription factor [Acidobacteria bacterium]|nr:response regulator transcription factor [Acidobacteriota bacterium]
MTRILIVEDEPDIAMVLQADLRVEGYDTEIANDGESAIRRAKDDRWDLILLDVMLPLRDGFEVCREIRRARVKTRIILLTAKTQEAEKVMGLELGADDYVTKPFSPRELRARIRAVLRRDENDAEDVFRFSDCEVDFQRGELRRAGKPVELTPLEFKLISVFVKCRGRVLSRDQLIQDAWGHGVFVTERAVDYHILNLRRKVEPEPAQPQYIQSVRGMGYRFDAGNLTQS